MERAARLAAAAFSPAPHGIEVVERAVAHAVATVAADTPRYYDEHQVRELLRVAVASGVEVALARM